MIGFLTIWAITVGLMLLALFVPNFERESGVFWKSEGFLLKTPRFAVFLLFTSALFAPVSVQKTKEGSEFVWGEGKKRYRAYKRKKFITNCINDSWQNSVVFGKKAVEENTTYIYDSCFLGVLAIHLVFFCSAAASITINRGTEGIKQYIAIVIAILSVIYEAFWWTNYFKLKEQWQTLKIKL